jgi:hypothetical protein
VSERVHGGRPRGADVAGADEDEGSAAAVEAGLGDETADVAGGAHDEGRAGARRLVRSLTRSHLCLPSLRDQVFNRSGLERQ